MQQDEYFSLSFSSYSSNRVAEIAGKISDEIKRDSQVVEENVAGANAEEDFEFSSVCENPESWVGVFPFDGQIQPIYPVFNRDLLLNDVDSQGINGESSENVSNSVQVSLRDLFLEEREPLSSSSSSEVDELESIPPGTYCVWKPKLTEPSPSRCKKSNSTGSAFKRWNIRDLMRRSNSEGKDSFIFLTPEKELKNENSKAKDSAETSKVAGKLKAKGSSSSGNKASSSPAVYLPAKEMDKNKRKSYLPYRRDLVGFFSNANSFGRTFPPF